MITASLVLFILQANAEPLLDQPRSMDKTNVASGQSVFWALVAIALCTMSQPPRQVCGFSPGYSFALKSSPVICAIDSVCVIIRLIWNLVRLKSLRNALVNTVKSQPCCENAQSSSLLLLRRNSAFRILLFAFSALPQAIKLYSIEGLLWAQLSCSMYLANFAIHELLSQFSDPEGSAATEQTQTIESTSALYNADAEANRPSALLSGERRPKLSSAELFAASTFTLSLPLPFYAFARVLFTLFEKTFEPVKGLPVWIGWSTILILRTSQITTVFVTRNWRLTEAVIMLSFFFSTSLGISAFAGGLSLRIWERQVYECDKAFFLLLGVTILFAIFATLVSSTELLRKLFDPASCIMQLGFGTCFTLLHLLSAAMYYFVQYRPDATRKPWWTEYLG